MADKPKILVECHHLAGKAGTGLATYAQNLGRAAVAAGYPTAGLFGIRAPIPDHTGMLASVLLRDARPPGPFARGVLSAELSRRIHADRGGVRPLVIPPSPVVVDPRSFMAEPAFAEAHVVYDLARRARDHFRRHRRLMPVDTAPGIDALHVSHVLPIRARRVPTLVTVHDIIPLRLPYAIMDDKAEFHALIAALVREADHLVTVSDHSRRDMIEFFNVPEARITNTYQSVALDEAMVHRPEAEIARELHGLHGLGLRDYYLFVGAIEPKKNVSRLLDGYAASGSTRPLVLAGGLGWQYEDDLRRIHDRRFTSLHLEDGRIRRERRVRHLHYLPRADLLRLIRGARGLIFPSLYEGFGLPVLEAMLMGTPVITSKTSSLPEVAGDAALLVDPFDSASIGDAIRQLDADDALCAALSERGKVQAARFSMPAYSERLDALYKRVL